jgi:MoxR-like ATPase
VCVCRRGGADEPLARRAQELFGPLSLRALEQDLYVRQTKGYLPDASVAFIDEVRWACSAEDVSARERRCQREKSKSAETVQLALCALVMEANLEAMAEARAAAARNAILGVQGQFCGAQLFADHSE